MIRKYLVWKSTLEANTPLRHWIGINLVGSAAIAYYLYVVNKYRPKS